MRSRSGLRLIEASATAAALARVEGCGAGRLAVAAELDLLDPRLRRLQPRLALLLQPVAFAVELDRFIERGLAALEPADDLLEPLQRGFEGELGNGFGRVGHGPSIGPGRGEGQAEAGDQTRGWLASSLSVVSNEACST